MAPARAIEREARETGNGPEPGVIEYGRQIELPDEIPPAPAPAAPAAKPRPAPAAPARQPAPAMASRPAPAPAPTPAEAPRPSPAAMRARLEQTVREQAADSIPTLRAAATPGAAEASHAVTIPVQVPPGQTGEILIRIVFKPAA
jgi:translation initiation factor IF-2